MRVLWLVFERVPHPDAVAYPAGESDVEFVLEWLGYPYFERVRLAEALRRYLEGVEVLPLHERGVVPCRRGPGLYHLVPWRLAKWLSRVLAAPDGVVERTAARLRAWRSQGDEGRVVLADSRGRGFE